MSDLLLELSRFPLAKNALKKLSLPVPTRLRRPAVPGPRTPLSGKAIAVHGQGPVAQAAARAVAQADGETITGYEPEKTLDGLVFDATALAAPADLGRLYEFVKPRLAALSANARVVLVGAEPERTPSPGAHAAQMALVGFMKSLGKEIGRRGCTTSVLWVDPAAPDVAARLAWPLTWSLADASAYVSGQALAVTGGGPAEDVTFERPLAGKTALVTGAARGIGQAIAAKLAAEGARVVGLDRPAELQRLETTSGVSVAWGLDLLAPGAAEQIASRVEAELGGLDILVNNAGVTRDKTLARMPRDWWDETLAVNLAVPLALTERLGAQGLAPNGRVVFLSSINGIGGNGGQTNYAAAKSGLVGATHALAKALAPRGVTVNAVAPGFIETEMTAKIPLATREVARRLNALAQGGRPSDVAEAVAMFAAPGAFAVTGQVLRVCGLNFIGA